MYPKQFFVEQFSALTSEELLVKLSSEDLTDNAKEALRDMLAARGVSLTEISRIGKEIQRAQYRRARGTTECDYCGDAAKINFLLNEGQRFCSAQCLRDARISEAAVDFDDATILQAARKIRSGACPVCSSMATPVEVRYSYTTTSIIIISNQETKTRLCCVPCGRKENRGGLLVSFFIGWWGIPWGPIFTIAALFGNLKAMFEMMSDEEPSDELMKLTKNQLAVNALEKSAQIS